MQRGLEISPAGPVAVVPLTSAKSHFDNKIEHTGTAVEVCACILMYSSLPLR